MVQGVAWTMAITRSTLRCLSLLIYYYYHMLSSINIVMKYQVISKGCCATPQFQCYKDMINVVFIL